ncbi:MAG TPA: flagellin [Candidatus Ozemobacteraceae bacterium]|nr:flagellin [Candidatus Ozemobacteraceae bacterium]
MALRINTNVTALTAHRNLVGNDDKLSSSIERLSSGLRINRAADDAAGLTISEKLRTQVRGINRAIMNVQDGISLIQTAEGALNEIQSMLQRMRELALQSGNDTLTTTDRLEIQKEVNQLKEDINRISYGTEFNTRKLLDGTGTAAISTSDPKNLEGIVTGEVLTFSDFSIVVFPQAVDVPGVGQVVKRGTAQQQRSNIFVRTDGQVASGSTTLQSIANFVDNNGYFILDQPQTLYIQGDNSQGKLTVSKDLTLDQLADRIQSAMTTDQLGNGLHFDASTSMFSDTGETNGQMLVTSGKMGNIGRINFTGEENLVKALGFESVVQPEDPVYSIAVTNLGVAAGNRTTVNTQIAGHVASGLIQGIDLMFEPPTQAFARTMSASLGITIPAGGYTFDIGDSSELDTGANSVTITIPAGNWAMTDIANIINTALETAGGSTVRARLNDAQGLEFYTLNTGSSAYIDIAGAVSGNVLGINDGRYYGTGGTGALVNGTAPIVQFDYRAAPAGPGTVSFTLKDLHNPNTVYTVSLDANYSGLNSIIDEINGQISATTLKIQAVNNNGSFQLKSLETGVGSGFSITASTGLPLNTTLYIPVPTSVTGFDGNAASQNFSMDPLSTFYGYNIGADATTPVADDLHFFIADMDGNGMDLTFPEGAPGAAFVNIFDIANTINSTASTLGVKVNAEIDTATQTLRIFSTIPGESGKVVFTDLGSPDSANTLFKTLGVTPQSYENGVGDYSFKMHVKDTSIQFQIGPNQGHTAKSNIIRTDIDALGIRDLDLTTVKSATEAIGLVDKALQKISSERAKLGAIENRMNYTMNSLRIGLENMAASDSRIRDVDMAAEVIQLTRFQVLQQSSNAMLAQANTTSQRVLDLLR